MSADPKDRLRRRRAMGRLREDVEGRPRRLPQTHAGAARLGGCAKTWRECRRPAPGGCGSGDER